MYKKIIMLATGIVLGSFSWSADDIKTVVRLPDATQEFFEEMSFEEMLKSVDPYNEDQVRALKEAMDNWKRKQNTPLYEPIIQNRSFTINFDPQTMPEELYFSSNYTTTIIFLDKLGNPWPITNFIFGNSDKFEVQSIQPSTLIVTPKEEYAYGNLTVMFQDKNVPAIFTIKTLGNKVDYKVEARINEYSPLAENLNNRVDGVGVYTNSNKSTSPYSVFPEDDITKLLNGEPNQELLKNKKTVIGYEDITIYENGEKYYILTKANVRYPEPLDARQNASGQKLYITPAMPILYLLVNSELIKVTVND